MNKRLRKFMLWAPLAKVATHLGLDITGWKCFSWEAAEFIEANKVRKPMGQPPKEIRWDLVHALKERGAHNHVNMELAILRAQVQGRLDEWRAAGVTTGDLSVEARQEVIRDAIRAWHL